MGELSFIFSFIQPKYGIYQLTSLFLSPRNIAVNLMGKFKGYVHAFLKELECLTSCLFILSTWCKELTHWKRPWCWERLKAGGQRDDRGWDGWYHWLNGHEFEQAPGAGDGQGSVACYSPWGCRELDMTEWLNWLMPSSHRYLLSIYYVYVMWTTRKARKNQKLILSSHRRDKIHLTNKSSA